MAMSCHVLLLLFFVAFAGSIAEAQIGKIPITRIEGTIYCTVDGSINGSSDPVFGGALATLRCGIGDFNIPTSTALTDTNGNFTINSILNAQFIPVSYFINNCSVVVPTPLIVCNTSLPLMGGLKSSLTYVGNTISYGIFNTTNFAPSGFHYEATL